MELACKSRPILWKCFSENKREFQQKKCDSWRLKGYKSSCKGELVTPKNVHDTPNGEELVETDKQTDRRRVRRTDRQPLFEQPLFFACQTLHQVMSFRRESVSGRCVCSRRNYHYSVLSKDVEKAIRMRHYYTGINNNLRPVFRKQAMIM